jgi:hypothetical protein
MDYEKTLVLLEDGNTLYLVPGWLMNEARQGNASRRLEVAHIVIDNGVVIKNRYGKRHAVPVHHFNQNGA